MLADHPRDSSLQTIVIWRAKCKKAALDADLSSLMWSWAHPSQLYSSEMRSSGRGFAATLSPSQVKPRQSNTQRSAKDLVIAGVVFGALFLVYNANGREIGSVDSQPNKFAARELLQRHTLTLNYVVGATPQLIERHSFVRDLNGNYRSAYSPLPPILAASIAWPLVKVGALNLKAPLAPNVIAVLAASVLTALAVALGYLTARERSTRRGSLLIAAGLGLGTGFWSQVSQTLWVHETAILGVALAAWAYGSPANHLGMRRTLVVGIGLAVAGVSRPQLAPLIGVLLLGLYLEIVNSCGYRRVGHCCRGVLRPDGDVYRVVRTPAGSHCAPGGIQPASPRYGRLFSHWPGWLCRTSDLAKSGDIDLQPCSARGSNGYMGHTTGQLARRSALVRPRRACAVLPFCDLFRLVGWAYLWTPIPA